MQIETQNVFEIREAVVAAEAHVVAEEREHQRIGQRLRDDRKIHARHARAKREPAEYQRQQPRHHIIISSANVKWLKPYQNHGSDF